MTSQRIDPDPEDLRRALGAHKRTVRTEWEARPAAVLVPFYRQEGAWWLLYTRRTDQVESHRGQVSFPGGLIEEQDPNPIAAALRECEEELGIQRERVEVLGQLDPLLTVTQFEIAPVVGIIPWPYSLRLNPVEVVRAFGVPLRWLADRDNLQVQYRSPLGSGPSVPVFYYKEFDGEVIWGATARITLSLLDLLDLRPEV
jgi:8-oxo-dGTP pyrophosphatase MutT (NUDIX family)